MQMPGRKFTASNSDYRYGFNGKENDNEVKGEGNQQDYGMRIYDGRLGKFLSVDPLTNKFPMLTPYQFASNTPVAAIDLDGLEAFSLSLGGGALIGLVGRQGGVGAAIGNDGIAYYTYDTQQWGVGVIGGVGVTGTLYPTMKSVGDIGGESAGISVSGGFLQKYSVGTIVSGDDFGLTGSYGFGAGVSLSYDLGITKITVIKWDKVAEFIKSKTDLSNDLQKIFGITDKNIDNSVQIIKDFYQKTTKSFIDKRKADLKNERMQLKEDIKSNKNWLEDFKKDNIVNKFLRYSDKQQVEASLNILNEKLKNNEKEEEVLNNTIIEF